MQKSIEVLCPLKLTLFLNYRGVDQNNSLNLNIVNQTIDIYDRVVITEFKRKNDGINIKFDNYQHELYEACKLFLEYTKISVKSLSVEVEIANPDLTTLGSKESILAGLLLGLNRYYDTNLTKRELLFLASLIGKDVSYFIISGYAKVDNNQISKLSDNKYEDYVIVKPSEKSDLEDKESKLKESKIVLTNYNEIGLHNDYINQVSLEILRLRTFLNKYKALNHSVADTGNIYFIAYDTNALEKHLKENLKKEFPNYNFYNCKNSTGHKIITKYLNYY